MEKLDVIAPDGKLLNNAACTLYSTMVYPDNVRSRSYLYYGSLIDRDINNPEYAMNEVLSYSKERLIAYRELYSYFSDIHSRYNAGLNTGVMLQSVVVQDNLLRDNPESLSSPPSLKRSRETLSKFYKEERKKNKHFKYNSSTADKEWQRFKSVAHLWAAYYSMLDAGISTAVACYSAEELSHMLALAKSYFYRARNIFPHPGYNKQKAKKAAILSQDIYWIDDDGWIDNSQANKILDELRVKPFECLLTNYKY